MIVGLERFFLLYQNDTIEMKIMESVRNVYMEWVFDFIE